MLMACTVGNKCAKNLCKRTVLLQLIIENVVTCFFWNTVYIIFSDNYRYRLRFNHQRPTNWYETVSPNGSVITFMNI